MRRRAAGRRAIVLATFAVAACERTTTWTDGFRGDVFGGELARWCERYHHAHPTGSGLALRRSNRASAACTSGGGASCVAAGCDPCGCEPPCSPCAKVGDPNGNAVVLTTFDAVGGERFASARFTIERQLPRDAHVGIYVAIHPHCHTTVQGLLVADGRDEFHLNVAAINEFIGGDGAASEACRADPFAEISAPLATGIRLLEGRSYTWRLSAELVDTERIDVTTEVLDRAGASLAVGRHEFRVPGAERWFGVPGGAARYAFGAQLTQADSPSGGEPALLLESFSARP